MRKLNAKYPLNTTRTRKKIIFPLLRWVNNSKCHLQCFQIAPTLRVVFLFVSFQYRPSTNIFFFSLINSNKLFHLALHARSGGRTVRQLDSSFKVPRAPIRWRSHPRSLPFLNLILRHTRFGYFSRVTGACRRTWHVLAMSLMCMLGQSTQFSIWSCFPYNFIGHWELTFIDILYIALTYIHPNYRTRTDFNHLQQNLGNHF